MTEPSQTGASADLRDVIGPVWGHRWLIIAVVVTSTVATYTASGSRPERYRSSTQLFVSNSQIETIVGGVSAGGTDRTTLDQAKLLVSRPVTDAVKKRLGLSESGSSLAGTVSAQPVTGSNFVNVSAERATGAEAANVANAYAQEYIRYRNAQLNKDAGDAITRIRAQLANLPSKGSAQQRDGLVETLRQLQSTRAVAPAGNRQTDLAAASPVPFAPRPKRDALFALAISVLLAVGLAFGLERFDRRIKRFDEVADAYGVPLLATIPHSDSPTAVRDGNAVVTDLLREPFRALRTHLQLASLDDPASHLAVTSAIGGEGKSTLTRNLALTYREWGLSVVVVDADLRNPSLARLFGLDRGPYGLTSVLTGESSLDEALVPVEFDLSGIEFLDKVRTGAGVPETPRADSGSFGIALLPSGPTPPNPQAVLAADKTRMVVQELRERFDIVIVDTPPLLVVSDAIPLISHADGVIVVARIGKTERPVAQRLMATIRLDPQVRVLGVVANDLPHEPGSGYGYGYGYGEYGHSNGSAISPT